MDDNLYPKIVDFGLSKFGNGCCSMQSSVGLKGTFLYMAPETMLDGQYSTAGDVYAFSIITYKIFTNEQLFKDYNKKADHF